MSTLDDVKRELSDAAENLKSAAREVVAENHERIDAGLDRAARFADEKTDRRYHDDIDRGVQKAQSALDRFAPAADAPPPTDAPRGTGRGVGPHSSRPVAPVPVDRRPDRSP